MKRTDHLMYFKLLLLPFFLIILSIVAKGQRTEEDVIQLLTNGSEKTWLNEGTETILKGSDDCDDGGYIIFRKNKSVLSAECIAGKFKYFDFEFSIRQETLVDWYITFGEKEFYLVMTETAAYHEIKLRAFTGVGKSDPALDKILKYMNDD